MIDISDQELIMLIREQNEDAEKLLYNRYFKIIKNAIYTYKSTLQNLNIDLSDIFDDCLDTFNYALNNYSNISKASFYTYTNLLINRKIKKTIIKKINENKHYNYVSLNDLEDKNTILENRIYKDALKNICSEENIQEINSIILKNLSSEELKYFILLLQGHSYKDIAKISNKNYNQIYYKIKLIKKKIISKMKQKEAKLLAF